MKPILFNTDMVRAILEGRKTVTRRALKQQPMDTDDCQHEMQTYDQMLPQFYKGDYSCVCRKCGYGTKPDGESVFRPPYRPGDILYVRETWAAWSRTIGTIPRILYKADRYTDAKKIKWRPSIHMPREAARIFLRVTDVRVEKLQDITETDMLREGVITRQLLNDFEEFISRKAFALLWDSTIKPADRALYGWEANPYVWKIEFERCEKPKGD